MVVDANRVLPFTFRILVPKRAPAQDNDDDNSVPDGFCRFEHRRYLKSALAAVAGFRISQIPALRFAVRFAALRRMELLSAFASDFILAVVGLQARR